MVMMVMSVIIILQRIGYKCCRSATSAHCLVHIFNLFSPCCFQIPVYFWSFSFAVALAVFSVAQCPRSRSLHLFSFKQQIKLSSFLTLSCQAGTLSHRQLPFFLTLFSLIMYESCAFILTACLPVCEFHSELCAICTVVPTLIERNIFSGDEANDANVIISSSNNLACCCKLTMQMCWRQ